MDEKKEDAESGFFGKLGRGALGFFVEEVEPSREDSAETHTNGVASTPAVATTVQVGARAEFDPQIVARLEAALRGAGAASIGTVLSLFESMADVIPDESVRLRAAFKAAQGQGVTALAILSDFDKMEGVLADEEQVFSEESERAATAEIDARRQRMAALDEQAKLKQQQVEALRAQITALEAGATGDLDESRRLGGEVVAKQAAIERVQATFRASLVHVRTNLANQKAMITALGKGK